MESIMFYKNIKMDFFSNVAMTMYSYAFVKCCYFFFTFYENLFIQIREKPDSTESLKLFTWMLGLKYSGIISHNTVKHYDALSGVESNK